MHKAILMALLAVVSSSAMAEWVVLGTTDTSTVYVEPTTIRKSGNKVKMWSLENFNSVQEVINKKYLSTKTQDGYDCKEEQYRTLYFTWHSENMGGGNTVYVDSKPEKSWEPVAPNSVARALWKYACGK
jgi:hypothetical protein